MKILSSEEALNKILESRYLAKDESGRIVESIDGLFNRVADAVSAAELKFGNQNNQKFYREEFYRIMKELKFLPNSPTLMNAGRPLGQLAACFVLPVEDSLEGIFETVKRAAIIHQTGGGTGFSFSRLRPKGDIVSTTGGIASGVVSFMEVFNSATEAIRQGGTRRGANMAILRIDHPDVLEFIECKRDKMHLNAFNISVGVTDEFIHAYEKDSKYPVRNPRTGKVIDYYSARKVMRRIAKVAWETGDPGILFIDRINRQNPTPELGEIEATNPCGEQPLLPNEACNLGSIDLKKFVENGKLNYEELQKTVRLAVRFLDDVVEINKYPFSENREICLKNRKIGLGIMGFAHMLVLSGIPYDSEDALSIADEVMKFISEIAVDESRKLAEERGAFENFQKSIFARNREKARRNATLTTIAPTGTISMIARTSSGIEPIFSLAYTRRAVDIEMFHLDESLKSILDEYGNISKKIIQSVEKDGRLRNKKWVPEKLRRIFPISYDINPEWHVRIQEVFQKHVENAVSKTVNIPRDSTPADVLRLYEFAFKREIKGITVYRDTSKSRQVLCVGCGGGRDTGNR
jgi:ribonucleoside-diphosphate reductase alpha chain